MLKSSTQLSLIIPVFNEEESLPHLIIALTEFCRSSEDIKEIIFIDDGSTDRSAKLINEFIKDNAKVSLIRLRRNCGKSRALKEGFKKTTGELLVTLDADLQDNPVEIDKLVAKINEGYDLVVGWRKSRSDSLDKRFLSWIYNRVTGLLSGIKLHDFNCGLKIYRREMAKNLNLYGDLHRYIPVLVATQGYKIGEVPVKHEPRRYGKSKYGPGRILNGYLDFLSVLFITRFSYHPLHLFGFIGSLLLGLGIVISLYLSFVHFFGEAIGRRPLLTLGILLIISGLQLISTGLIGELVTNYFNAQGRDDTTVVKENNLDS